MGSSVWRYSRHSLVWVTLSTNQRTLPSRASNEDEGS